MHGVTSLTSGVRYSLFLCKTVAEESTAEANAEVELVAHLTHHVSQEFDFFERAVAWLQQTNDDGIASVVENEYQTWFDMDRAVEQDVPCPSLAVEIVSKAHMLRPLVFAKALSTKRVAATSMNTLVVDVRKQQSFMVKVLNNCRGALKDVERTVLEYMSFLRLSGRGGNHEVLMEPTLLVDLVWHVHMQLFRGSVYGADSIRIAGRLVDHEF